MSTRVTRVRSRATGSESARQIHASSPSPVGTVLPPPVVETPLNILATAAAAAASEPTPGTRTKSGRVSKPPVRYEPVEQVEDDYADDDYDTDESDISSTISSDDEDEEEDDDSDADDDGNLDGFVVPDKSESSDSDSDGEPPVSVQKRRAVAVVKKRPATASRK
mgnify:CR=1 FL=1